MVQLNIDSAIKITKVTENAYMYPQVTFPVDTCLESLIWKFSRTASAGARP
jgi:hypothetical protein